MLERITKWATLTGRRRDALLTRLNSSFMAHPETLLPMPDIEDPVQRFVSVVKFYLSGWHIKPPYVSHCIVVEGAKAESFAGV